MLHGDPRVAGQRPELVEAVDRVGGTVPPVGEVSDEGHRELRATAADVDRDRRLHRCRAADGPVQREVLPVVVEELTREHERQDLERLAQPSGALRRRSVPEPERADLLGDRAPSDAEVDPPARERVDGRDRLREDTRVAERVARHHVAEADRRRLDRERGRERPRFEDVELGVRRRREVIDEPRVLETDRLGRARPLEDRRVRHPQLRKEHAEGDGLVSGPARRETLASRPGPSRASVATPEDRSDAVLHPEVDTATTRAMHSVEGRTIIVTGSGQGVGRGDGEPSREGRARTSSSRSGTPRRCSARSTS